MKVTNSTFSGKTVSSSGGAIGPGAFTGPQGNRATLTVINSTFSGNSAREGGGGAVAAVGMTTIISSTFVGNSAAGAGDIDGGSLRGTIVAAGKSSTGNCFGPIADLGYNISDDNSCGFTAASSLNNTDPMLDPAGLHNNGGPTQTIALLPGSLAIDAIPLDSCTDQDGNQLTTDQRGFPSQIMGNASATSARMSSKTLQEILAPRVATARASQRCPISTQLNAAVSAMRFRNMRALQQAIRAFCKE